MASHVVRPETRRLELPSGEWLVVRRRLNWGEQSASFRRGSVYVPALDGDGNDVGGRWRSEPVLVIEAKLSAYILDWSFTDDHGQPLELRDSPIGEPDLDRLVAHLRSLDSDIVREIREAIDAHEAREEQLRADEKKTRGSSPNSEATLNLPSDAGGVLIGSAH